jgi:sugar phosphate isomerase/epimerase
VNNTREIAQYAEKLGVYFAIENHQDGMWEEIRSQDSSGHDVAELLDRVNSPYVGCCLDAGNGLAFLETPLQVTELLAPQTITMHVKDFRLKRTMRGAAIAGCLLGKGAVDVRKTIELVVQKGPRGKNIQLHIEAPVERLEIPFLESRYWTAYEPEVAMRLPQYLQLLAERGEPAETDFRTPVEQGWAPDDIFAHELKQVEDSIKYVQNIVKEMQ